jgi:hypothetical protein
MSWRNQIKAIDESCCMQDDRSFAQALDTKAVAPAPAQCEGVYIAVHVTETGAPREQTRESVMPAAAATAFEHMGTTLQQHTVFTKFSGPVAAKGKDLVRIRGQGQSHRRKGPLPEQVFIVLNAGSPPCKHALHMHPVFKVNQGA